MRVFTLFVAVVVSGPCVADEPVRRSITVEARSEIRVVPDEAVLDFTIETQRPSVVDAKTENDRLAVTVARAIATVKFEPEAFRVTDFGIDKWYQGRPPRLTGYTVRRSFQIRTAEFAKIEPAIAAIVKSAGDSVEIHELNLRVRDQREHQSEARRLAMEYARTKASHLAELNGMVLGAPTEISEDVESSDGSHDGFGGFGGGLSKSESPEPRWDFVSRTVDDDSGAAEAAEIVEKAAPIEMTAEERQLLLSPGQVSLNATVNVTFDLVPKRPKK